MDDEWISFIDDIFALNDRNKANLLAKELLNINASAADTPESFFSTFMKFSRVSLENTSHNSINDVLDIFYKANLSYIKDPKVKTKFVEMLKARLAFEQAQIESTKAFLDKQK